MSDNAPAKKPSIRARLREFMDSLGDVDEVEETEIDADAADLDADEETSEIDADEIEPGSEAEADAAENADGADETPGTEAAGEETAEDDDLRAVITEQAAQIETYRNALAAAGLDDPLATEVDVEANLDADADTQTEEDAIAAFDEDYAHQEAMLAQAKEN